MNCSFHFEDRQVARTPNSFHNVSSPKQDISEVLADAMAPFAGTQPPFADLPLTRIAGALYFGFGPEMAGSEAQMASKRNENIGDGARWGDAFWFAGVAMFVVELSAGLDYVQAQLAAIVPSFLGNVPVLAFVGWNIAESAFWNCGQLEAALRIMPLVTLPFVLLVLAISMKQGTGFAPEHSAEQ